MNVLVRVRALAVVLCAMGLLGAQATQAGESGFYAAFVTDGQKRSLATSSFTLTSTLEPVAGWTSEAANRLLEQALKLQEQGDIARSQAFLVRAADTYRISLGPHSQQQLLALVPMLDQYLEQSDWSALSATLADVMRIYAYHYEPTHPVYIQVYRERAQWHLQAFASGQSDSRLAELESAYQLFGEAIKLSGAYYGNTDPELPDMLYNLAAVAYLFAGNYQDTEDGSAPAVIKRTGSRQSGDWHPERASFGYMQGRRALEGVVSLHSEQSDRQAALVEAHEALADWHEAFGYHKRADTERELAIKLASTLSPTDYQAQVSQRPPAPWKAALARDSFLSFN